jgi:hypothetical protein
MEDVALVSASKAEVGKFNWNSPSMQSKLMQAGAGAAKVLLLTVGVFSLYISGFAFYHSSGVAKSPRDKIYEKLSNPETPGVVEGTLRTRESDTVTSPSGKPCLVYQTQVVKWETFHDDIDDPSSTSETKVFEECGQAFRAYLEHAGGPIYIDVTELDPADLTLQQKDLDEPPNFVGAERTGFKAGFVAPDSTFFPNPDAQETHYELRETAIQEGERVTAIGQPDSEGWLRAGHGLSKPLLLPGSRAEVLERIEGNRNKAAWMGIKYLLISLFSFVGLWLLRKRSR